MTMKYRLYLTLLMAILTVMAAAQPAQTAQELLSEANTKYEAGEMETAIELYTQAANKGLAEAQFQLGKIYFLIFLIIKKIILYQIQKIKKKKI